MGKTISIIFHIYGYNYWIKFCKSRLSSMAKIIRAFCGICLTMMTTILNTISISSFHFGQWTKKNNSSDSLANRVLMRTFRDPVLSYRNCFILLRALGWQQKYEESWIASGAHAYGRFWELVIVFLSRVSNNHIFN